MVETAAPSLYITRSSRPPRRCSSGVSLVLLSSLHLLSFSNCTHTHARRFIVWTVQFTPRQHNEHELNQFQSVVPQRVEKGAEKRSRLHTLIAVSRKREGDTARLVQKWPTLIGRRLQMSVRRSSVVRIMPASLLCSLVYLLPT